MIESALFSHSLSYYYYSLFSLSFIMVSFSFVKTLTLVAVLMALLCAVTARADEASCVEKCKSGEDADVKCQYTFQAPDSCSISCSNDLESNCVQKSDALPLALMSPARVLGGVVLALAVAAATL